MNNFPNPFNRLEIHRSISYFDRMTRLYWNMFPPIQMTRVMVLSSPVSLDRLTKNWNRLTQWFVSKKKNASSNKQPSQVTPADVLIAYSTPKPSWYPALEDLGTMLVENGTTCCIIAGRKIKQIHMGDSDKPELDEINFDDYMDSISVFRKCFIIISSLVAALLVSIACSASKKTRSLLKHLPLFFFEFVESYKNLIAADFLLSGLKSKIVITNGEHLPVCSELTYTADASGSFTVWFYNEWPSSAYIPYMSKGVWTWNHIATDAIKQVLPSGKDVAFEEVGRAEADYLQNIYPDSGITEDINWVKSHESPLFLFLMDFDGNPQYDNFSITRNTMEVLGKVGRKCENWKILVKPRVFQYNLAIPGEEYLNGLSNCRIIRHKSSLGSFLHLENTKLVGGCQSSGLLTAAAAGVNTLRLLVPGTDHLLAYIDTVCTHVKNADELVELLHKAEAGNMPKPVKDEERMFPYRGQVVQRMKDLVLEKLQKNGKS